MKSTTLPKFILDVILCSISSMNGPFAHEIAFSNYFVKKRGYLTEDELNEIAVVHGLIPGLSATQTITAIGYELGGPLYAVLGLLVWALPSLLLMALLGVLLSMIPQGSDWERLLLYLPTLAISIIVYIALVLSKRVLKAVDDWLIVALITLLAYFLIGFSYWFVPLMIIIAAVLKSARTFRLKSTEPVKLKPRWWIFIGILSIAILNEVLAFFIHAPFFDLFVSFYRIGYSGFASGVAVIPMLIQDLVNTQSLQSVDQILSAYAITQAIPGPFLSFSSFIASASVYPSTISLLVGLLCGISAFLPGILFVFFVFPLWRDLRKNLQIKALIEGLALGVTALVFTTALHQIPTLGLHVDRWLVFGTMLFIITIKKIPMPLVVIATMLLGLLIYV